MSDADGLSVRVVLSWLGDRLVVRRIVSDPRGSLVEYWASGRLSERDLVRSALKRREHGWNGLAAGAWVDELGGPVSLIPAALDELDPAALSRQRTLLSFGARLRREGGPVIEGAEVEVSVSDPLAAAVRWVFDPTLSELRPAGPPTRPGPDVSTPARIELDDVRGAQVGERTVQINRFVAVADNMRLDFDAALRRAEPALAQLRDEPDNPSLRAGAVAAMEQGGLRVFSRPASLRVPTDRGGVLDALRHVIGIRVGSSGVQVGDDGTQRNEFRYLVTSPSGDEVLRAHPEVARALVDCACPSTRSNGDVLRLTREVEHAVQDMSVRWTGSRVQHQRVAPPAPGEVVHLQRVDGVQVAGQGRQQRIDMTEVGTAAIAREQLALQQRDAELARQRAIRAVAEREIAAREIAAREIAAREIAAREIAAREIASRDIEPPGIPSPGGSWW